jgi:tetratricopeptide (TPR) repeat protein
MRIAAVHAAKAGMRTEAAVALRAVIRQSAQIGDWASIPPLGDAARLLPDGDCRDECLFLVGKAHRLSQNHDEALLAYQDAQSMAGEIATQAQLEYASVLALAGRDQEAEATYRSLSSSSSLRTRLMAATSMSVMYTQTGRSSDAIAVLTGVVSELPSMDDCKDNEDTCRLCMNALQALAYAHVEEGEAEKGIGYLNQAEELRGVSFGRSVELDALGWYHFFKLRHTAFKAVGDRVEAAHSAERMAHFARLGMPLFVVAEAVYFWSAASSVASRELESALEHIAETAKRLTADDGVEAVIGLLAAATWCTGEFESAISIISDYDNENPTGIAVLFTDAPPADGWSAAVYHRPFWCYHVPDGREIGEVLKAAEAMKGRVLTMWERSGSNPEE